MPDELDLLFGEIDREDPEAPVEEIDDIMPEISKMKTGLAEESAGGSPVKKSKLQKFLHQMVKTRGRNIWKEQEVRPQESSSSETSA